MCCMIKIVYCNRLDKQSQFIQQMLAFMLGTFEINEK